MSWMCLDWNYLSKAEYWMQTLENLFFFSEDSREA